MTPQDPSRDDARLADLLATLDATAAAPDEALLAKLRAETGAVFDTTPGQPPEEKVHPQAPEVWRRKMFRYGMIAAAAVVLLGLSFVAWLKPVTGPSYAEIIAKLEALDSFQATYSFMNSGDCTLEYIQPAIWRLDIPDDQPGFYFLARAGKFWQVEEAKNQATSLSGNPFWGPGADSNLGALLLPEDIDPQTLHPVKRETADQQKHVFTYEVGRAKWPIRVTLDAATETPTDIVVHAPGRRRQLTMRNINRPLPAERFQLKDTLTEDGRVGQVLDIQGVVSVRPVGRDRWTPLAVGDLLKPGDLVRSNPRGPNAARVRLVPNTDLVFGPGTTLEVKTPTELRLLAGDIELHPRGKKIQVGSPGQETLTIEAKTVLRTIDEKLTRLAEEPAWLKGFKGAVANESLGSLLANVDGRNVPLNVGYHKVDVDIRDGLARTTIEESFVNTTNQELDGTFYFPLPADASIAGFGMWIGNELVEADVVEKQRAREIFNIILSEKKDPGLLEWSGGNLFKTRVYPIPAHGEKRIKITYTQALPLEGQRFRYNYALVSDLLKQHPLRELSLTINVSSAWPLAKVYSPTHPVREEKAGGAARLVFTAQQHTPTRDFEAIIELASKPSPVTLLPHRRGDDGYFLLRINPPGSPGDWERDLVRDGAPLHVLLLCDTSASIDKKQREQQTAFVTALLGSLTAKDTFNLACADVETDWAFPKSMPAESKHLAAAQEMLQRRRSLGWTDLEKALASAMKQSGSNTHVIYLGDGTPATSLGHDPKVFIDRFKTVLGRGKGYVHGVALGSLHESMVLKAMAGLSGGSWRKIAADRGPAQQARDLLLELTDPNLLRDMTVAFEGVKVARVYPETLPNLRAGTELILTGRYLPRPLTPSPSPPRGEGGQTGKVILTGRMGEQAVRFSQDIQLPEADAGNSFIPRLWARQHIEHLLETGGVAARDEIIARAEEFHLMTPYTSFLVLEDDAMRERFAVKRRFGMRDGEKFFAEGRSQSELLLRQKQMRLAADWRVGLRRQALARLTRLGRELPQVPARNMLGRRLNDGGNVFSFDEGLVDGTLTPATDTLSSLGDLRRGESTWYTTSPGGMGGGGGAFGGGMANNPAATPDSVDMFFGQAAGQRGADVLADGDGRGWGLGFGERDTNKTKEEWDSETLEGRLTLAKEPFGYGQPFSGTRYDRREIEAGEVIVGLTPDGEFTNNLDIPVSRFGGLEAGSEYGYYARGRRGYYYPRSQPLGLNRIFPTIPALPLEPKVKPAKWAAEIVELVRQLDRRPGLQKLRNTHLVIDRVVETYDLNRNHLSSQSKQVEYLADKKWLTRHEADSSATRIEWCDAMERGVLNLAFHTGRTRPSTGPDRQQPHLGLMDHSTVDLVAQYGQLDASLERLDANRVRLTLVYPDKKNMVRFEIDTARKVVLKEEHFHDKKLTSSATFTDFQNVAGQWWAGRVSRFDAQGKLSGQTVQQVQAVGAELLQRRWEQELKDRPLCLVLPQPLPSVEAAKQGIAGGKGSVTEHVVLMAHFALSQQWTRVKEHLAQVERLAANQPAPRWLRILVLYVGREHETLRQRVQTEVQHLIERPHAILGDDWTVGSFLQDHAFAVSTPHKALEFLSKIEPIYKRQPGHLRTARGHRLHRANFLWQAGRIDEARVLYQQLAATDLFDYSAQWLYFTRLLEIDELDAARDWLFRLLRAERAVLHDSEDQFWNHLLHHFKNKGRYRDLHALAAAWIKRQPSHETCNLWYLASLVLTDQQQELDRTLQLWINAGPGTPESADTFRFRAAYNTIRQINHALHEHQNQVPEQYFTLLLGAAEKLLGNRQQTQFVGEVLQSAAGGSAAGMKLRRSLVGRLHEEAATLPRERLGALVATTLVNATHVDQVERQAQDRQWEEILTILRRRWSQEQDQKEKHAYGNIVSMVLAHRKQTETVAFLRERLQAEHADYRAEHLNGIYHGLQSLPWTPQNESELLALVPQLDDAALPEPMRVYAQAHRLLKLVDHLATQRQTKLWEAVKDKDKLTRTQQAEKQQESAKQARKELAARLQEEAAKGGPLAPWLTAEALYLRTQANVDLPKVAEETWKALDALPAPVKPAEHSKIESVEQLDLARLTAMSSTLNEVLRERHLAVLAYLATKKATQAAVADRLIGYLEKQQQARPDEPRWQQHLYQLLIALDRPQDLETRLRQWLQANSASQRWRIALAYLQAERGGLNEAVQLLEKVKAEDELRPAEWRVLTDWYLAIDQKERSLEATTSRYDTLPEEALWQWLQQQHQLVSRASGDTPSELHADIFRVIPVLFRKSTYPAHYTYVVQALYQTTRDFRLLSGLAEGVVGHTPGRVYPFLRGWGGILGEIRDEATLDELSQHLQAVRQRAKSVVDHRALDLLELLAHRRAAELQNQPGPHIEKAAAALERAMKREWTTDEPGEMAELLASLGKIAAPALAEQQLAAFGRLHAMTEPGSPLRLRVDGHHARTQRVYGQNEQAVKLLLTSIDEARSKDASRLIPAFAQAAVDELLVGLRSDGRYDEAERWINVELAKAGYSERSRLWLKNHRFDVHLGALWAKKPVALGTGEALFRAMEAELLVEAGPDRAPDYRLGIFNRLDQLYRLAHEQKLPGVKERCRDAIMEKYPPMLASLYQQRVQVASGAAETLRIVVGYNEAVAFLLDEFDRAPAAARRGQYDAWQVFHGYWASWRPHVTDAAVRERLFRVVLDRLSQHLAGRRNDGTEMFYKNHQHFWGEKEEAFAAAAMTAYTSREPSMELAKRVATYLAEGLQRRGQAVELLRLAERQKVLDEDGRYQMVVYLIDLKRHAEAIPELRRLIAERPMLRYHLRLMGCYYHTGQGADLRATLAETEKRFGPDGKWNTGDLGRVAQTAYETHLFGDAVRLYDKLIPQYRREQQDRGLDQGTLWNYYRYHALSLVEVNEPARALDAISAAILLWGRTFQERDQVLESLRTVMQRSKDLRVIIAHLDAEAKRQQGKENPLLRRVLAGVLIDRKEYGLAVTQLRHVLELNADDAAAYALLIQAYDELGQKEQAATAAYELAEQKRRESAVWKDLGQRFAALNQPAEAERAYTSIIEMLPSEAEGHQALAQVRQGQNRWEEAITHWKLAVQYQSEDPSGLLGLIPAQIHQKLWTDAAKSLEQLRRPAKPWHRRFNNLDVPAKVKTFEQQIQAGRK